MSFTDATTADALVKSNSAELRELNAEEKSEKFSDFNGSIVHRHKVLTATVKCNEWTASGAQFYVLGNHHTKCRLLGANNTAKLGLAIVQRSAETTNVHTSKCKNVNVIGNDLNVHANWAKTHFPDLFTRTGRFNNHTVNTKFRSPFVASNKK